MKDDETLAKLAQFGLTRRNATEDTGKLRVKLLASPRAYIVRRVNEAIQSLSLQDGYVGVHLRWLEGSCHKRSGGYGPWCSMDDEYLKSEIKKFGKEALNLPLFLAHDRQQKKRVQELKSRFFVKTSEYDDVSVDTQLLIKATHFIGNNVSSLSGSVHLVRKYLTTASMTLL